MSPRKKIQTTVQELAYRHEHYHDIRVVKERHLVCTSCGNELNISSRRVFSHPWMGILQCEQCHFKEVYMRFDKDKTKKYCYICGSNTKLYVCCNKTCISAFCKKCIKRNVSFSLLDAEKHDWECFICNPKPLWELRAVCATVLSDLSKKANRRDNHKFEKCILSSEKQRTKKTKQVQRALKALCDDDSDDRCSDNSFVSARLMQKTYKTDHRIKQDTNSASQNTILEVNLIDSSSESSSTSYEDRERKSRKYQKSKLVDKCDSDITENSDSTIQNYPNLAMNGESRSRKNRIFDNSDDDSSNTLLNKTPEKKHAIKHRKPKKKEQEERNKKKETSNYMNFSDSESESENESANELLNISKSLPKYTTCKKMGETSSYNMKMANDKPKKHYILSENEFESGDDIEYKKQTKQKNSTNNDKDEQTCKNRKKSLKRTFNEVQQDDESDASSGKEFQKIKIQKVHRDKYSKKQLKKAEINRTKSTDLEHEKNEKSNDEQTTSKLNETKDILQKCKKVCQHFLTYIDFIEQLYGKVDEEKLELRSIDKINKVTMILEKKGKDLATLCQSWSKKVKIRKSAAKKSHKAISDNEQFSEENDVHDEEQAISENKYNSGNERGSKDVSECDSEEIFSADESRTLQKMQTIGDEEDQLKLEEVKLDDVNTKSDKITTSTDKSTNDDSITTVLQDEESTSSPILGISKQKNVKTVDTEIIAKQLFPEYVDSNNEETNLVEDNNSKNKQTKLNTNIHDEETASEEKVSNNEVTLQDNNQSNTTNTNVINELSDLFDTSDYFEEEETEIVAQTTKTSYEKTNSLSKNKKTNTLDTCETSLQDKIPNKNTNASAIIHNITEEKNLSNQDDQEISVSKETVHDNSKETDLFNSIDDDVSNDEAEMLAKKALLESDSDTSDNMKINENITKQTEDSTINISPRKDEVEDNHSISSNTSTVIIPTCITSQNISDSKAEDIEVTSEESQSNKKSDKESENFSDEMNAKKEEAAKKALLESNSEDSLSIILSSLDSEETDEKNQSNAFRENAAAKQALLASSNSENSDMPISEIEVNISNDILNKDTKSRKGDKEVNEDSLISRLKKRKLKLTENHHYKNDKKLKMSCRVCLKRLSQKVLKHYSQALEKSKEYLEQKALKSLVNLDKLEKRYKKKKIVNSDTSTDDDEIFASAKLSKHSNKRKGNQTRNKEESLMDHLKKIENGEVSTTVQTADTSSDESIHQIKDIDAMPVSNEALMLEANKVAKENLLKSSDSDAAENVLDSDENINNDAKDKKEDQKKKYQKQSEDKSSKQDNDKQEENKSNWRRNKILTIKFSDSDSDIDKQKWNKTQEKMAKDLEKNSSESDDEKRRLKLKKKKIKRRILDSDSDQVTDCSVISSDSDVLEMSKDKQNSSDLDTKKGKEKRKKHKRDSNSSGTDTSFQEKKAKPKRKRIKNMASDSDSSDGDIKDSPESISAKSGRKNIRKVLKDKQVAENTKLAAKEEEERLKRIADRQALYNEVYEMRLAGEEKVDKLVLDFDTETKEELVSVHKKLVKRLKPHQAQGIKFMWDACFESLERAKTTSGSGCIIAHCMGLGKTLQVVTLTHTLLTHETTDVKTVLIVCPLSTVLNWLNEYNTWLKDLDADVNVYELTKFKKNFERKYQLQNWQKTGGVMILSYNMFRNLTGPNKNIRKSMKEVILECLVDPGADLIVCDEGHLLKNEDTALSKCMRKVKTMRRIVLTGTPLQNNLIEYHCMVQFVKPNLLGTKKEFLNRFVNPITNGQFDDSTVYDVKLMKKRAHVLHKMLEGSVQRFDYSVLTPFLPPKQEYVIFVRLTDIQIKMYQYYLDNLARCHSGAGKSLFADFQALQRIWTHPIVLRLNAEKVEKANEKKELTSESEGSLKDFINDDTTGSSSDSSTTLNSDSDVQAIDDPKDGLLNGKRKTRNNPGDLEEEPEEENKEEPEAEWWAQFVQPEHFEDVRVSAKLLLLFGILKECEQIGDKVLVFSQSLYSLTLIEEFLARIDDETQNNTSLEILDNHTGSWSLGLDYFRLDGQTSAENRSAWCKIFNRPTNTRARLFLISTRAGGLGINLTAANRVIIFDASWNPSHDVQSIFRIYRFGQKKPCYVYRFLAANTMEEKIYNRQVTKLSLSCRVVDEQQIERHYSNHNLNELYMFEPYDKEKSTLNLPKDRLLAEIFLKYKDVVENYHEHDSLLENKAEEELDEEERKQAWLEYEEEKKGKPSMNPIMNPTYQNNMWLQQYNMMINSAQPVMASQGISLQMEYENLQQLIRKDYPNATPEQQKMMTNRALMEMYNYWEKQATLYQPLRNSATISTNLQQRPMTSSHGVINSNVHQTSQLSQLLTPGQTGNYLNKSVQPTMTQRDLLLNPYRSVPSTASNAEKTDDDIIEVIPTTSNAGTSSVQVAIQSTNKNNNQEE